MVQIILTVWSSQICILSQQAATCRKASIRRLVQTKLRLRIINAPPALLDTAGVWQDAWPVQADHFASRDMWHCRRMPLWLRPGFITCKNGILAADAMVWNALNKMLRIFHSKGCKYLSCMVYTRHTRTLKSSIAWMLQRADGSCWMADTILVGF